jgi:hypothetical protein
VRSVWSIISAEGVVRSRRNGDPGIGYFRRGADSFDRMVSRPIEAEEAKLP